jgi:GAF domain-containing protein/CheY-like chemotaxis protein
MEVKSSITGDNLLERTSNQLTFFQEISQLAVSDVAVEHILATILDRLIGNFGYYAAQIYRLAPVGDNLWLYIEAGQESKTAGQNLGLFTLEENNIISEAVRQGKWIYVPDVREESYPYERAGGTERPDGSELAVPLKYGQKILGVVRVQAGKVNGFENDEIAFISSLANLLASLIKNNQTIQHLQDSLGEVTTLYDLHFEDKPEQRAKYRTPISYQYEQSEVTRVDQLPEVTNLNAISEQANGISTIQKEDRRELIAPIQLYGETIGLLGVEELVAEGKNWTVEDVTFLEEVTSQVALAIENARLLQQTRERTKELATLFEATRDLAETVEVREIYRILARRTIEYLDGDRCSVLWWDEVGASFKAVAAVIRRKDGDYAGLSEQRLEKLEDLPGLEQMVERPAVIIEHVDEPGVGPKTRNYMERKRRRKVMSLSRFPVVVGGKLRAVMVVEHWARPKSGSSGGRHEYSRSELQLAEAMIAQVTVALEKAGLFQQTQTALADTERLFEISSALVESTSMEDIFRIVLETVKRYEIDRVSISLLDRSQAGEIESVTIVATWDRDPSKMSPVGTKFSAHNFALVQTFAEPPFHPLISHDLGQVEGQDKRMDEAFRRFVVESLGVMTLFSAPMFLGAEYKGVLSIYTRKPHVYTEQEVRIYQTLADQAIIAIENQRLLEATRKERDRASLLYEMGQALNRTTTIDQAKAIIIGFGQRVGAAHCEIYMTDGGKFLAVGSTVPGRQGLADREMAEAAFSRGPESLALRQMRRVRRSRAEVSEEGWPLEGLAGMPDFGCFACIPFESQRSTLFGVLTFLQNETEEFSEEQMTTFEAMAVQTAAALENVWLLEQTNVVLKETELLYKASRGFNSAQGVEDLLRVMVDSFAGSDIDFMGIALIPGLSAEGRPLSLRTVTSWVRPTTNLERTKLEGGANREEEQRLEEKPGLGRIEAGGPTLRREEYSFIEQLRYDSYQEVDYSEVDTRTQACIDEDLYGLRSLLFIPLSVGRNWLGTLVLGSKVSGFVFRVHTIHQIYNLAGQAAVVLQSLQLVEETQQNLYYSEVLSTLGQQLLAADSKEAIYELALSALASSEPDRGIAIFMYDYLEGGVELELVATWDNPRQSWPAVPVGARFSTEDLGLGPLLKTGLTLVSNRAGEDERFSSRLKELLALMQVNVLVAIPLWLNKEVGGFILISHEREQSFAAETVRLYEDISREVSGALENRRLFEEAQYRTWQLQTAAEISQTATAYLNLETLLAESANLIRDRFEFYHVSIFLVDEYRQYAVVQASTGEIGQKMLARKHRLKVDGRSLVGAVTRTGKPRVAWDVGQEAVQFNYSLLPETRSEMALPLIAQGRVIGVLDVHSSRQRAFSEGDITILQSMANQLANAIEAARSFLGSKKALDEASKLHEHYLREEWGGYLQERKNLNGFRLVDDTVITGEEPINSSAYKLAAEKRPVIVPGSSVSSGPEHQLEERNGLGIGENGVSALIAPLTLNGQAIIGTVDFEIPDRNAGERWDEDVLRIVEAVTSQAAQAIEAARLFEQTQVSREEAEALYEVGRALVAAESEPEMFQTVLGKMLATLGLKQGGILLFEADKAFGKLHALFEEGQAVAEPDLRIPIKNNLSYQRLIETKRPIAIEDIATDPLVETVREINISRGIVSLLLVPIVINDEVVGAIGADSIGQKHIFSEKEMNLAMAMADQLSITLQNRRLIEETQSRAVLLQTSFEVGRVATSILDEGQMIDEIVELIKERFGFHHVQIFLMDEVGQFAVLHKSTGEIGKQLLAKNHKLAVGSQSVIGQVTDQHKPLVARMGLGESEDQNSFYYRNEFLPETRAELAVPLQVGDTLIGALDVQSTWPNAFNDEEISTLSTLAGQLAVAILNARAFREQQESAERLKEMDKLKTQFLANMSHELRTPLNSIIGFSRVILKGIDGPLTELQKTDLSSIYNSGQHLLGLINNILDLSKIEAGKMELNFEETEVEPIVKTVMATAMALVKDKQVTLQQETPDNLPKIWADPTRIRQVILNLVSNACKFTDEGVVTLRVKADQDKVTFSVSDTGIGIPEDQLTTIFEEFTQVDASTTRKAGGTGLGLPISRHFVEMHYGNMWVESNLGQGSTFNFYIPIRPPMAKESNSREGQGVDHQANQGIKKLILAIDDDPSVITLYKRYLEKQNYEVIGIHETRNILAQVKEYAPFAILLDVIIPEKDGWSVIKELKEDAFTRDIPVIICSIVSDKNRGFSLGAANYLIKPIVEHELVEAVRQIDTQQKGEVKVLVVDDQADDILLIRRILEAQPNYSIIEAANGKEGLELVKSKEPDLIILDLNMPEMNGFAMIEALKANEKTRSIPIIIVSAKELSADEQHRLIGQVEVLLHKGIFTENELLEDVSQALERLRQDQVRVAD